MEKNTWTTKLGLARMLRGGVIMDVVDADQARIAEEAGAAAVMALERVPAQIRADGVAVFGPAGRRTSFPGHVLGRNRHAGPRKDRAKLARVSVAGPVPAGTLSPTDR